MKPVWIMGSNVDASSPLTSPSERLKKDEEEDSKRFKDRERDKKNSDIFEKISFNLRGLVRGFTSLSSGGINGNVDNGNASLSGGSLLGTNTDALMRVFNDTWQFEMGGKGPGTIAPPLNDGAGKNYGTVSLTQKWNMQSFRDWLKQRYPNLEKKLVGTTCSEEFDASWRQLGETDYDEFLKAQVEFTFEDKVIPNIEKIKEVTGVDLNNGQYSEGVFSILLSMMNQRPAWVNEKWIPFLKKYPNASSEDIINGIGGDIANNYNGNYASAIRNRYKQQVANALKMNTPFKLGGGGSSSTGNSSIVGVGNSNSLNAGDALNGFGSTSSGGTNNNPSQSGSSAIDKAVSWAVGIANDNKHGYSQANRWGDDYDCSSLIIQAYQNAGIPVKDNGASYTGNMYSVFTGLGFTDVTSETNHGNNMSKLQKGDVLLNDATHTEMYIGDGKIVGAHSNYDGVAGDSSGSEIDVGDFYAGNWQHVLRAPGSFTPGTNMGATGSGNSSINFSGSGKFDSTHPITEAEKNQLEAQKYWEERRKDTSKPIYSDSANNIGEDIKSGKVNIKHTSGNTSGWKDTWNNYNYGSSDKGNTFDPNKSTGGTSKWENVHNNNNTPNFNNTPKPDIDLGGTPIVPDIPDTGTDYVPPTPPEIIYPPSIEDSGNNKPSKPDEIIPPSEIKPNNPIYFFDKEKFEKIMTELNMIEDYTSEIANTNKLLEKMKKVIKEKQEKCNCKDNSNKNNISRNVDMYNNLFSPTNNAMAMGY